MVTMKHKWLILKLKLCVTELNLMTRSHFIEILVILTKYLFYLGVRLTEFSVIVESVTLRFYCTTRHKMIFTHLVICCLCNFLHFCVYIIIVLF